MDEDIVLAVSAFVLLILLIIGLAILLYGNDLTKECQLAEHVIKKPTRYINNICYYWNEDGWTEYISP